MNVEMPCDGGKSRSNHADGSLLFSKPAAEMTGLLERLCFALGPLGAGLILDFLDLATFGPVGLLFGAVVGGSVGWTLSRFEGFGRDLRIAFALCAAAYMTIPFTEAIPAATILSLLARFFLGPRSDTTVAEGSIDAPNRQ